MQALERALAKHPSSMPAVERWTAIANDVPGKTRKECVERFKQVRRLFTYCSSSRCHRVNFWLIFPVSGFLLVSVCLRLSIYAF